MCCGMVWLVFYLLFSHILHIFRNLAHIMYTNEWHPQIYHLMAKKTFAHSYIATRWRWKKEESTRKTRMVALSFYDMPTFIHSTKRTNLFYLFIQTIHIIYKVKWILCGFIVNRRGTKRAEQKESEWNEWTRKKIHWTTKKFEERSHWF